MIGRPRNVASGTVLGLDPMPVAVKVITPAISAIAPHVFIIYHDAVSADPVDTGARSDRGGIDIDRCRANLSRASRTRATLHDA
jgi:hypothetical protein